MQTISISADEYARHVRNETIIEILDIYYKSTEYSQEKFIKAVIAHAAGYLPFTTVPEPQTKPLAFKDIVEAETENDWEE